MRIKTSVVGHLVCRRPPRSATVFFSFACDNVDFLLREIPHPICMLLPKVALLRELFPSADATRLVEKAPMLLALNENTLRVKSDAWRHILEPRVDVPWEQVN